MERVLEMPFHGQFTVVGSQRGQPAAGVVDGGKVKMFGIHRFNQAVSVAAPQLGKNLPVFGHEIRAFAGFEAGV
ncbi:hypothetical protein D3C81_2100640 [compost metagenome]